MTPFREHLALALASSVLLAGCASTVPLVTQSMAAVSRHPVGVLEQGRRLYAGACSSCHAPYAPASYSPAEWHRITGDMSKRSKLSAAEHEAVLAYVLAAREMSVAQH